MKPRLRELLERAERQSPRAIDLGLERPAALLAALGHPERGGKSLHIAGTNGKGSTLAFLDAMLREAGFSSGSYTSPHLIDFNERISVNGVPIPDDLLERDLEAVFAANGEAPSTFFELTTAAAFLHLARENPDWRLVETGLGGRLDATNLVTPELTLIAPIALDHAAFLGDDLAGVAREKAGIIKSGVPVIADPGGEVQTEVIIDAARDKGAPLLLVGRDFHAEAPDGRGHWRFRDETGDIDLPPPSLTGPHQYRNAALAVAAARHLELAGEAIRTGLTKARWPGRLECFPGLPDLWLDGAHNPAAARALGQALERLPPAPCHLIFSALADKDPGAMAKLLASQVEWVWTTSVGGARSLSAEALAAPWEALGVTATPCADPRDALAHARAACPPEGRIVAAGSLYLVGAVRSLLL